MRFKREDLGLYFATALIGGGAGLLAGALVTTYINRKREEDEENEPVEWEDEVLPTHHTINNLFVQDESSEKPAIVVDTVKLPVGEEVETSYPPGATKKFRLTPDGRRHLSRLTEEYDITPMQLGLVESGAVSIDELEATLVEEEFERENRDDEPDVEIEVTETTDASERVDYSAGYRDTKPDLDDLVDDTGPRDINELLVTIGNWDILIEPPEGKGLNQKRTLYFDPDGDDLFIKNASGEITAADLRVIATPEVQEIILPWLKFEPDVDIIYLNDIRNSKTRWYEILRAGREEVAFADDAE